MANSAEAVFSDLGPVVERPGRRDPTLRLALMMFLEFAVWGCWGVLIGGHMKNLGFTGVQIGSVYLTTAIGAMLSPLIAGWIADRVMPNQVFTGLVHLAGAGLAYYAWKQTEFAALWWAILAYSVLYFPTIALTNAIAFHHMHDAKKFGYVRVGGTIGWIVINWIMSAYLSMCEKSTPGVSHAGDCLAATAILSIIMGLYCFSLPHTPAAKHAKSPFAFLEALRLMSNRNFAVLLIISFIVAIELPFYYNLTFLFLTEKSGGVGLAESTANAAMSLGQVAEILLMLALAPALLKLGTRTTILLGILAWPVRYGIFAIGHPAWLVIAAQALHGICYSFFFVGGMVAVERLCQKDIRASAQGLLVFATNGMGMLIGSLFSGYIADMFVKDGAHDWRLIFAVPITITLVAAIAFTALFNERRFQDDARQIEAAEQAAKGAAA